MMSITSICNYLFYMLFFKLAALDEGDIALLKTYVSIAKHETNDHNLNVP